MEHGDLMAAAEAGKPGTRFSTGPYAFLRMHAAMLIREADPGVDSEFLADVLLASLATDSFFYWHRLQEQRDRAHRRRVRRARRPPAARSASDRVDRLVGRRRIR